VVTSNAGTEAEYFAERGFALEIEQRDLHAEHVSRGDTGRASFFVEGRRYYCVHLLRDGVAVARDYAHGETADAALAAARRRFGSEQG
jgi:hypothetical protein